MKKVITLVALATMVFSLGRAQTCDTLFNLQSNLDTATLIAADSGSGGYISGNNVYGDIALAEGFPVADTGYYLTSASFYFGAAAIDSTDSNNIVTFYVWDNTDTLPAGNRAPGNAIDSAYATLGQIAQSITENKYLQVHFTSTTELLTDSVYVGVVFPANASGDAIALYTNSTPAGPDGNGWVLALDPSQDGAYTWVSYNDNYLFGGGSLGNYIKATMCTAPNPNPLAYFNTNPGPNQLLGCSPFTVNFSDATSGPPSPDSWTWIFGDGNTANGPNATDVYTSAGLYTATELVSNDTGSVVDVFVAAYTTVGVVGTPVVTVTTDPSTDNMADASAYISVTSLTGHYFTFWFDSGTVVSITDTLSGVFNGVYVLQVQDQDGCTFNDSVLIEPNPTGIINLNASTQVSIYPNPATTELHLIWSQNVNAEVSVIDLNGNVLSTVIANGETETLYDIHNLASGAYILRITDKATNQQQSTLFTKF